MAQSVRINTAAGNSQVMSKLRTSYQQTQIYSNTPSSPQSYQF